MVHCLVVALSPCRLVADLLCDDQFPKRLSPRAMLTVQIKRLGRSFSQDGRAGVIVATLRSSGAGWDLSDDEVWRLVSSSERIRVAR